MSSFDRRKFLSTAAAASAVLMARPSWAGTSGPALTLYPDQPLAVVPADFTGLSYESSQLAHPRFFSADNTVLIQFFKTLGSTGILRLGGNMSEFTFWSNNDPAENPDDDGVEGPDPGKGTDNRYTVTPRSIRNLAGFLDATGWKLIYGLNLAAGTPEAAAQEAAYVAKTIGPNLIAFQFGNEPDLFKHNGDPKDRWTYAQYIAKWQIFQKAVLAAVPSAPLAGPDTSFNPKWVGEFIKDSGGKPALVTTHYYAEGPPTDPHMTIDYLLNQQERFHSHISSAAAMSRAAGLPYRMAEGNTCYAAGKPGVSDTFASALWAGDFLAQVASIGGTGVNLHGGANGLYTPIAGSRKKGFVARPDYYGMLMARPLFGATMLRSDLQAADVNVTAYSAKKDGKIVVLAFNKDSKPTTLALNGPLSGAASVLRLTAPAITATSGVTLGGSAVAADGTWAPTSKESLQAKNGSAMLTLPAYSGALVTFA